MFDHITIRVADRAVSERFFETVLARLGIDATRRSGSLVVWNEFMLTESDERHGVTRGLHVAFAAPSRQHVEDFWKTGIDAGYDDDGPPGPRPQYREDYYGAFLTDPTGNSVEAVHHGDIASLAGVVDHLWIRVADLAAATAFYRAVATAAGFAVRHEGSERTTFASEARGGSFSLVPGPATENLHLAFPGDDEAVHRFYADTTAAGYRGNGEPGERPRYHPGYYAAFVLDPDGNNIEVVNHHRS